MRQYFHTDDVYKIPYRNLSFLTEEFMSHLDLLLLVSAEIIVDLPTNPVKML
jgi:hypothetical protein